MEIIYQPITRNDCYQKNVSKADSRYAIFQERGPLGLMLHSVGCSQPSAKVFADRWNQSGTESAVHAVLQADGYVYQLMPWNYRAWHGGGAVNDTHIGVEMTEPACIRYTQGATFTCSDYETAKRQVEGTYKTARDLFAFLCLKFGFDPMKDIISHNEGGKRGIASTHVDPEHLWRGLGMDYTMDGFRKDVKARMEAMEAPEPKPVPEPEKPKAKVIYRVQVGAYINEENAKRFLEEVKSAGFENAFIVKVEPETKEAPNFEPYVIRVTAAALNVRSGPGTGYDVNTVLNYGDEYHIVEENDGWGRLKSGAGWICLAYTESV